MDLEKMEKLTFGEIKKQFGTYENYNSHLTMYYLRDIVNTMVSSRAKEDFELPTRLYNKFDKIVEEINMSFNNLTMLSGSSQKFIIYMLLQYINEIRSVYDNLKAIKNILNKEN